jgi:hypothetical protein
VRAAQVLVVSAIAHAPLLVYLADAIAPRARPRRLLPSMATPTPSPPAPIEVAFFVDEPAVIAPSRGVAKEGLTRRAAIATTTSGPEPSTTGATPSGTSASGTSPSGTSYLRMRGPDLGLSTETAERIAAAGEKPDELRKSGRLRPQPGGAAVVHDLVTTMTVDPDGKVHFDDIKDIDPKFRLPIPKVWKLNQVREDLGHELTEWFKDPEAGKRFGPSSELPRHLQASPGACDQWGATMCDDPLAPRIEKLVRERKKVMGGFLGGAADITAWLHRKYVGDPYLSRKLKLLDDTRDERVAMGEKHRAQQQARSAEFMRRNLDRLWAVESDPVARRAALFTLWDECGDDEAGARARAVVIGWIRARLPAGSQDAYTDDELKLLQTHRTSSATFAPYVDEPKPD